MTACVWTREDLISFVKQEIDDFLFDCQHGKLFGTGIITVAV